ncbi:hypothetical protein G6F65_020605 [Rhizopus arrhizus]|nr:hypothetical protein G6F65_020605 [Rhizopus arrhizus]
MTIRNSVFALSFVSLLAPAVAGASDGAIRFTGAIVEPAACRVDMQGRKARGGSPLPAVRPTSRPVAASRREHRHGQQQGLAAGAGPQRRPGSALQHRDARLPVGSRVRAGRGFPRPGPRPRHSPRLRSQNRTGAGSPACSRRNRSVGRCCRW